VITEVVRRDIPADKLCVTEPAVQTAFDDVLRDTAPEISARERDGLLDFFEQILNDFRSSDLWDDITHPETDVRTEFPIDGAVTIDNVEIEIHGQADFLIEWPDGRRHVTDIKIALTEPTEDTQKRYELQTATYAYLFTKETMTKAPVERSIETFGVTTNTTTSDWPPEIIERRLATALTTQTDLHSEE
jgi:ATP-dependent helicase/nuclease subunit A